MKNSFFALFFAAALSSAGQTAYKTYRDRTNHYSIYIPADWKYTISKDYSTIKLFAYHTPVNAQDSIRDNFNVNIIDTKAKNLEEAYSIVMRSVQSARNFKLVDSGKALIKGKLFKWLIENHDNLAANLSMSNYVFATFSHNKIYILTLVSLKGNFLQSKELFDELAASLDIKG